MSQSKKEAAAKNERWKGRGDGDKFSTGSVGPKKKSSEAFKGHQLLANLFASCQSTLWTASYFPCVYTDTQNPIKSVCQITSGLWGKMKKR